VIGVKSGSAKRGGVYKTTISHAVVSGDSDYNAIAPLPSNSINVTVLNPCTYGFYSWPPGSGNCL